MVTDDIYLQAELEQLGLTSYQATIYVLLVRHHELTLPDIAEKSGLSQGLVYKTLEELYELGIAEEIIGNNHRTVRPYSIGAMRHGLDNVKIRRLKSDLHKLDHEIALASPEVSGGVATVQYYSNRSGARQLYLNSLEAKNTMYVYSDWSRERYTGTRFYEEFVAASRARGLKEKVLLQATPATLESIRTYSYPDSPVSRTLIDDIRVIDRHIPIKADTLMYNNIYAQVYLKNVQIYGFEIQSEQFVQNQRAIFEVLWRTAEPIRNYL